MKQTLPIISACLLGLSTYAQSPTFEWSGQIGGVSNDLYNEAKGDGNGNIVAVGGFNGTADVDPSAGVLNLTSAGQYDIFVQKLDASGAVLWSHQFGSTGQDFARAIDFDAAGNIYIAGAFSATVDFDPGAGTTELTATDSDAFVLKLDANGTFQWVQQFGGAGNQYSEVLKVTPSNHVMIGGINDGTVDVNPGTGTVNAVSNGQYDFFVSKLNSSGTYLWGHGLGGANQDLINGLSVDANNNVYMAGGFQDQVDFDPGAGTETVIASSFDVFVLKFTANGLFEWVSTVGGGGVDMANYLVADDLGNTYIAGTFSSVADFDPGAGSFNLTSNGSNDCFLQKMDPNGANVWAHGFGGNSADQTLCVSLDGSGNVYTTGAFVGTVDLDPGTGVSNYTSFGAGDSFIQKFDANGNLLWVDQVGANDTDQGVGIHVDDNNEIIVVGTFLGTGDFEPGAGTTTLTSAGAADGYIVTLSQCIPTSATDNVTACESYTWIDGNTYTASNNSATFILTNAGGCDSVVTLNLTINALPSTTVTQTDITLTADATGATYQWVDCDNAFMPISGATNQNFTATSNGNYAVIVSENGCSDTSSCYAITEVGLEETSLLSAKIYPNPTKDRLFVQLQPELGNVQFELISSEGKIVQSLLLNQPENEMSVGALAAGVYTIRLQSQSIQEYYRFVKQ